MICAGAVKPGKEPNPENFVLMAISKQSQMSVRIISKQNQAHGAFNGGQIVENKPIGFPQDGGFVRPYSSLFYWARARAVIDSTIGLHPHQGFEIMSFVMKGKIRHFDTKMNAWKELGEGGAQIIRAGNGIQHAEHMYRDSVMFQIWVDPDLDKTLQQEASYDDYSVDSIPTEETKFGRIHHFAGAKGPMKLESDLEVIQKWEIERDMEMELPADHVLSAYVVSGNGRVNWLTIEQDDFIVIEEEGNLRIQPTDDNLVVFAILSPVEPGYKTYVRRMQERLHAG